VDVQLTENDGWLGENPYYLVISTLDENIGIDLDRSGWLETYAQYMRVAGQWILIHKATGHQSLIVKVEDGDQPYYTARHVGLAGGGGSNEITAYGIGKKRSDGCVERLWVLPGGTVCGGDDVDSLGIMMIKKMGPR
jgi:hypothetical protein